MPCIQTNQTMHANAITVHVSKSPFPTPAGIQLMPYPMPVTVSVTNMYKPRIKVIYEMIRCDIESYGKCVCVCVCVCEREREREREIESRDQVNILRLGFLLIIV